MQDSMMELQRRESHFSDGNFAYMEEMYETYLRDPNGYLNNGDKSLINCRAFLTPSLAMCLIQP